MKPSNWQPILDDSLAEDAFAAKLVVTESVRKRILPVYPMKQSWMEPYQKLAGVEAPLEFAILLYRSDAGKDKIVHRRRIRYPTLICGVRSRHPTRPNCRS